LKIANRPARSNSTTGVISMNVQADRKCESFEIAKQPGVDVAVLDV
jgi:hypothetical protein